MTDAPRLARHRHRDYCAAATMHLLREREARYPSLVTAGKVTAEEAATRLELARAIVAQWRWVMDPAAPELPAFDDHRGYFGAHGFEMRDELVTAARRQRVVADRNPDADAAELADLYEALAWWQQGHPGDAWIIADVGTERRAIWRARAAEAARIAA